MKGKEVIATAAITATIIIAAYMALVAWVIGDGEIEAGDRFLAAFMGVLLIPFSTAGITSFIICWWGDRHD